MLGPRDRWAPPGGGGGECAVLPVNHRCSERQAGKQARKQTPRIAKSLLVHLVVAPNCLSPSALCFQACLDIAGHSQRYPQVPHRPTMGLIRIEGKAHVGTIQTSASAYREAPLHLWLSRGPPVSYASQHSLGALGLFPFHRGGNWGSRGTVPTQSSGAGIPAQAVWLQSPPGF